MDNINLEKVYAVLEYIEVNLNKEIDFIIDDYASEDVYLECDDIDARVEYSLILKDKLKKYDLTDEELDLVTSSLVSYMSQRIAARIVARNNATTDCRLREKVEYYGSKISAYDNLYALYLGNYGYYINIEDSLNEILERKQKVK